MSTPDRFSPHDVPTVPRVPPEERAPGDDPLMGVILGSRYKIERKLGRGTTGAVYRASHVKFGRAFAVKVLYADKATDTKLLRRFEREAELSAQIQHPNVVSVIDVGESPDGTRYMVQELAMGIDLATVLEDEAPLTTSRVIHLVRGLCDGLFHAHERGLIHRDLKPENIIIERDDHFIEVPRIVDFGIAIARDEAAEPEAPGRLTTTGLVLGTPHYMAPEQATGFAMDHRIDLFALGVFTFEMLTGVLPFDGTGAEVARANILLPTPVMAERAPGVVVDPLMEAFTQRLMAKEPGARPATAHAARELLDLIEKDRPAAAALLGVPIEKIERDAVPIGISRRAATAPVAIPTPIVAPKPPPSWTMQTPAMGVPVRTLVSDADRDRNETDKLADLAAARRRRTIALLIGGCTLFGSVLWLGASSLFGTHGTPAPDAAAIVMAVSPIDAGVAPVPAPVDAPEAPAPPIDAAAPAPTPVPHRPTTPRAPATPPPPTAVPSAADVASLYTAVGRDLNHLSQTHTPDVTEPMQIRFRRIRLADALASEAARREGATALTAIRKDIAAAEKGH
jgi:serine/threonine-protein kinase